MKLLHINADFDENGLETKVYDSIESFVQDRIGIAYSLVRMTGKTPYYNPYKTVINDTFIKYYLPQFCFFYKLGITFADIIRLALIFTPNWTQKFIAFKSVSAKI